MIKLTLDCHDLLFAIEGFAHGSHLRQHVWETIVYRSIPQMSADDMDYLWFFLRRDVFPSYFYELNSERRTHVGCEDFLHALAALHRGNRYIVTFKKNGGRHKALCYRSDGVYRPLYLLVQKSKIQQSFNAFLPDDWIVEVERQPMPNNEFVEYGKEEWWHDLSIYDNIKKLLP